MLYDWRITVRMDREAVHGEARPPNLPEDLRTIGIGYGADGHHLHDVSRKLCCICWEDLKKKRHAV
jgi:hypothetical protein